MKKYIIGAVVVVCLVVAAVIATHHGKTQTTVTATHGNYVALGDSVAAGVGLKTDSDSSACDRTNQAYSNLVASGLNYKLTNLACSGATLTAGILGQQNVNQLMATPQLDQLFVQAKPDLVTMTIGANDAGWTSFIAKCYTGQCGTAADTAALNASLATVTTNLQKTLTQIQDHYKTAVPHVVVTGYHQVFPTDTTTCSDLTGIDANELAWGRQQQASINDTIRKAVSGFSFAAFAPIDFSGHELCTSDSWVQGLSDKDPYHPTEDGQAAFAKQVIAVTKQLK